MTTCKIGLLASKVILDGRSNEASAIGIIDEIVAVAFPLVIPAVEGFYLLERDDDDGDDLQLMLQASLDNQILFTSPMHASFQGKKRTRVIVQMQGLPIPGPGQLTLTLLKQGSELCRSTYDVSASEQAVTPTVSSSE